MATPNKHRHTCGSGYVGLWLFTGINSCQLPGPVHTAMLHQPVGGSGIMDMGAAGCIMDFACPLYAALT